MFQPQLLTDPGDISRKLLLLPFYFMMWPFKRVKGVRASAHSSLLAVQSGSRGREKHPPPTYQLLGAHEYCRTLTLGRQIQPVRRIDSESNSESSDLQCTQSLHRVQMHFPSPLIQ